MHPAYFETRFRPDGPQQVWPAQFVIIAAWATTGETWTDAENNAADARLAAQLRGLGHSPRRITGYSPRTGHAEPGWAAQLDATTACALGVAFRQDALYEVRDGQLHVLRCATGERAWVAAFAERLD